jgi:hypothetical protein
MPRAAAFYSLPSNTEYRLALSPTVVNNRHTNLR